MTTGIKAARGVAWSAIERFSTLGVQFVLNIIIARILSPDDYGVIGMLSIFLQISQCLIDSGFSNALIQQQNRTERDFGTVFIFNFGISVSLYFLLFAFAPLIAKFYKMEILQNVLRVVGLNLIISSLSNIQRTILTINVDFKRQSYVSFSGAVVSGVVGILLAHAGWGVWALVTQTLVHGLTNTILLWIISKTHFRVVFDVESFKRLGSFGVKLMLSGLLNTIYDNLYGLLIGKKYSAKELGYYSRADQFAIFPSRTISDIISRVSYPVLCQHQDNKDNLSHVYTSFLTLSCYIVFPIMIGLSVLSKPLVIVVLTEKWLPVATMLSVLALDGLWTPITRINLSLLQAVGRSDLFFRLEIIKKIIALSFLIVTINHGLLWICIGRLMYSIIAMLINMFYTVRIIDKSYFRQISDWFKILVAALLMGVCVFAATLFLEKSYLQLIVGFFAGVASYFFFSLVLGLKEFNKAKTLLSSFFR